MLMAVLGLLDMASGISLLVPNFLGFYLGIVMLLKGGSSMLGLASGEIGILIMGIMDLLAGIMLLTGFGIPWFWLIMILKGAYSLVSVVGG